MYPKSIRGPYTHIEEIETANDRTGYHFFESDTKRFFASKILSTVYHGRYFITSEQFIDRDFKAPREYTIRMAQNNGCVDTIGYTGGGRIMRVKFHSAVQAARMLKPQKNRDDEADRVRFWRNHWKDHNRYGNKIPFTLSVLKRQRKAWA